MRKDYKAALPQIRMAKRKRKELKMDAELIEETSEHELKRFDANELRAIRRYIG